MFFVKSFEIIFQPDISTGERTNRAEQRERWEMIFSTLLYIRRITAGGRQTEGTGAKSSTGAAAHAAPAATAGHDAWESKVRVGVEDDVFSPTLGGGGARGRACDAASGGAAGAGPPIRVDASLRDGGEMAGLATFTGGARTFGYLIVGRVV